MSDEIPLRFYINNQQVDPPLEYRSIEVELNFENLEEIMASVTAEKFTFINENADLINDYVALGTMGGLGIMWGLPFRIELDNQVLFDGYIDLVEDAEFSCEKVICKVREHKNLDWLDKYADGKGFDLLYSLGAGSPGRITQADFIKIPYINSNVPDYQQAALYFLYAFTIEKEIEHLIKEIAYIVADIAGFFTTAAGVLKLIALAVYLGLVVIALIKLLQELLENLISPVMYHMGMLYKTHFEKMCEYLGYTFQSSLFQDIPTGILDINGDTVPSAYWANQCHIPIKSQAGFRKNHTTDETGFWVGTFGDYIRAMCEKYNAKFVIIGNVFRFERRDYGSSTEVFKIPNVRRDFHGTNASEIVSNYLVQFQVDTLDLNTVNRYLGTNCKNYITSVVKDSNRSELIRGFKQPNIPFALGRRKNELTRVESAVKDLLQVIDAALTPIYIAYNAIIDGLSSFIHAWNSLGDALNVIGINLPKINTPSKISKNALPQLIDNRIGMLLLSGDFIGVQKSVLIEGSGWDVKITTDNETKLSAENLWNKYHFITSFVPNAARPNGNQAYVYDMPVIPFCLDDYYKVRGLNNGNKGEAKVISPEGNSCKLLSLKWNIWNNKAKIRYAEEKLFTTNLQETLLKDTGS